MPKESIIQHYSSATTGNVPAAVDLALGELAINTADERVFIKNNAGTVLSLSQTKDLSGAFAKTSATVSSVNGFTGAVQVTGSGAIVHSVSGTTTTLGARLATTGSSGVASFNAVHFSMGSTGHVSLATGYTVTGDTVQAGSGISINAQKVITNTGVLTLPLASAAGATGVASFRNTHFLVGGTGHVQLAAAYQVTGDTVQAGSGISINAQKVISNSGVLTFNGSSGTVTYAPPLASAAGATGVASFLNTHFTVDTTGHVKLASAYTVTGDTVQAGSFINIGTGKTINNIGVQTLNGFTGAVQVTGSGAILHSVSGTTTTLGARLATTGSSGVASFNATHFTMGSTGHVSLATGYTVTGDTVQAGSGISINAQKVITNTGVLTLPLASAAGATGVASFRNTHFLVGGTGHVQLAAAYQVTGDTVQAGSGISINAQKVITNTGVLTLPLATAAGATGVASFRNTHFLVDGTGHVQLAAAYQVTGDTVITVANSGIAISTVGNTDTLYNIGVLSLNGFTGAVQVTGSGAIVHSVSGTTTTLGARLATTGSSGVASFNATHFSMGSTGHVSLATAYTVTGDTVQAGSGISINAQKVITNTGVLTLPLASAAGATGVASFRNTHFLVGGTGHVQLAAAYQVTGDTVQAGSGISIGAGKTINNTGVLTFNGSSGTVTYAPPLATLSVTGVASFRNTHFTIDTTGHVQLAAAYQVTGDTVVTVANSGIAISTVGNTDTLFNIGVLSLNSLTGAITLTGDGGSSLVLGNNRTSNRIATTSLTGVASFLNTHFTVDTTGHVKLASAYTVTGDTVQAGSGISINAQKVISNTGVLTLPLATLSVTGVASFRNTHFTVDTTGHVQLASAYQVTGDTVITVANSGIAISTVGNTDTLFNIGVLSLNGLTGATTLTGDGGSSLVLGNNRTSNRIATTSLTGVASFLNTHFTVDTTGHVKLASAYTVTGDTVQAGSGISINAQKVISNTGVLTLPLSTAAGATGVASFSTADFSVATTGHVSLGTTVARTNAANTFTSLQSFNAGVSASNLSVAAGATFSGSVRIFGDLLVSGGMTTTFGENVLIEDNFVILNSNATVGQNGGIEVFRGSGNTNRVIRWSESSAAWQFTNDGTNYTNIAAQGNLPLATAAGATGVASFRNTHFTVDTTGHVQLAAAYQATGDTVQAGTGITIGAGKTITNAGVVSLNGLVGAVTLTGDGASQRVLGNNILTNRIATDSATGVAAFNVNDFTVTTPGIVSLKTDKTVFDTVDGAGVKNSYFFGEQLILTGSSGLRVTTSAKSTGFVFTNTGVLSLCGLTGNVCLTGDGGAVAGRDNSYITTRVASASATGVASFNSTHFSMGSTGHVSLATAYTVTGDTVQAGTGITIGAGKTITNAGVVSINGLVGAVALTGDGGSSLVLGNNRTSNRIATTSLTGVASFLNTHFTVDTTGHVKLASAYTVTGDTVQAGSGINIGAGKTINNTGVLTFNGNSGTVGYAPPIATLSATGVASFDPVFFTTGTSGHIRLAAAYQATGSGIATVPLATTSLTGTASFNLNRFQVSGTGNVDLLAAFQVTGDTVVAGSFINFSQSGTSKTINNIGVQTLNGFTGAVQVTGSGAIVHSVSGTTTTLGARLTTAAGATGVASFRNNHFTVDTTGHVQLAAAYQITGDTVQAGSGISINAQKVISNTGVLTFNGSSGTVGYAPPLATAAGATGVASFRNTHFTVDTTGHVQLAAAYQVTGDTVVTVANSGIAISTVGNTDTLFNIGVLSLNGLTGAITVTGDGGSSLVLGNNRTSNRIATTSLTGVASFLNTHFTVDTTGHVKLATAYTVTGDTVQAGSGISIGAGKTINNTGVLTLPLASAAGATGVASFRNTHFTVGTTGHVQLASAYQVTGQTVVSGGASQLVSTSGNTVTIDNRIATASATGVASFSTADFVLGTTGHVSLTGTVAKTNVNNLFTAAQRFNSGLSGTSLFVGSSTTLGEFTSRELNDGSGGDVRVLIKSNHSNGLNLHSSGSTGSSLILNGSGVFVGHDGIGGWSTLNIGGNGINDSGAVGSTPNQTSRIVMRSTQGVDSLAAEIRMPSANGTLGGTLTYQLPQESGTVALTKNLVSAINGLTGAITLTGDGGSSLVLGNNRTSNRIATTSLTGVASFSTADFVLGTTGHVSLTGTVAKTNVANTFTALQSFSTGLSASNGITFGSNVTINGNLNATTKSFVIPHPSKSGMTLRYGSLEGPENGVYVRGRLRGGNTIELPDYWTNLVDEESITVNLTPIGSSNQHYVIVASTTQIVVGSGDGNIDCYYMVLGERKDVPKLQVEY